MAHKKIYFVQAGEKPLVNNRVAYLPYAVGTIAAKAWNNKRIQDEFHLERIIFLREPVERLAMSLDNPYLIGFSSYIWNHEYNKAAARMIKELYPACLIVFGGHSIPADTSMLEENPFIDILIHGEGEEVFEKLLCALASGGLLSDIPNIAYRIDGSSPAQTERRRLTGTDYPSPYKSGIFDPILKAYPEIIFHGTLETNRGCANNCAFCDWGAHKAGVKMFPLERIRQDIIWLSENKIEYVWGTDANFGLFDRDHQITDWIIAAKLSNGYPKSFRANYAKHNDRNVFELAKRFSTAELSKSTTISLQTLSGEALRNVGRHNISLEHFAELVRLYRSAGIPTYSEMILALPGETYGSFITGIGSLLDAGQHAVIEVYDCVLLANSAMADKDYISKYKIETIRVPFFQYHCEVSGDDVTEYSDIVISTNTMLPEDWVRCKLFAIAVQSMHCLGLLRCFSIFLHNEKNISYSDFYSSLLVWYGQHQETLGYQLFAQIREQLNAMIEKKKVPFFYDRQFGDVMWPLDEGVFLSCISDLDRFYAETSVFLNTFGLQEDIFRELLGYQRYILFLPGTKDRQVSLKYDFYNYMVDAMNNNTKPLHKVKNTLEMDPSDEFKELADYAREIVWYGRRLGLTIMTDDINRCKVKYV